MKVDSFGHVEQRLSAGGTSTDVGWSGQRCSHNQPLGKCRRKLGHATELEYGDILVSIESLFLHQIAQGEICRRAEAGDTDGFSLQVSHTFDLGERHHVKGRHVCDAADEDEVSAAKSRADDRSSS